MRFLHLSDLHLVAPGATLHGLDPQDRLRRCVAHICALHADAAFVVLTGDLTHGHLDPGMHVMTKPFAMEALASRIRELISG